MFAGIDFGTCYSSIAVFENGSVRFLKEPVPPYSHSWPSSVFLTHNNTWLVGHRAENSRQIDPLRYRRGFKREFSSPTPLDIAEQWFRPEELTGELLRIFKQMLDSLAVPLASTVLTIPAAYEDSERQRMQQAAYHAQLTNAVLLEEPIAAGLYYLYRHSLSTSLQPGQFCLIYDLGGGTFDAALILRTVDGFTPYYLPVGDNNIGGMDFDRLIAQDVVQQCPQVGVLIEQAAQEDQAMVARFLLADFCRSVKERLTDQSTVEDRPFPLELPREKYTLNRTRFQTMIEPMLAVTCQQCLDMIESADVRMEQIHSVLMVGGSTRIPLVKTTLERLLKRPVYAVTDPELAVCGGAAIHAALLSSHSPNKVFIYEDKAMATQSEDTPPIQDFLPIRDPFEQKAVETSRFVQTWDTLYQEVQRLFGPERADELSELHQAARSLHQAETTLLDALRCPMLTLATAGTTSGGKSTLVNMLCGAEIMPTAVGEMSAGVVQIDHHPTRRRLFIKATRGATWECGEWFNLSDEQIRKQLTALMKAYNEVREEDNAPECPQVELTYPMRLANADILRLPVGFKFRILDLPGLKHIADEGNSEIIRRCREALCFVTYNSAEPNKNLQERLLEEVVALVKELGGTPVRMMFVLNKIDVFRTDPDWKENEEEFVATTSARIKQALQQAFPEQMEEVNHLNILRLSSQPGLFALLLRRPEPLSDDLQRRIGLMKGLLSEETMEALYTPPKVWDERRRELMAQDFEKVAYADVFMDSLRSHINAHLPYLVIPQALDAFVTTGGQPAMIALSQLITALVNSSEARFDAERLRIDTIRSELSDLHKQTRERLRAPFEQLRQMLEKRPEDTRAIIVVIQDHLGTTAPYSEIKTDLYPFHRWRENIVIDITKLLEAIADALSENDAELGGPQFDSLPSAFRRELRRAVRELQNAGYCRMAEAGAKLAAETDSEKRQVERLNDGLNDLARVMTPALSGLVGRVADRETDGIYKAMKALLRCHVEDVAAQSKIKAPDIGLETPPLTLDQVEEDFEFEYHFQAGFDTNITTRPVQTGTKMGIEIEYKKVFWKIKIPVPVIVHKPVYEQRDVLNAVIPPVGNILANWLQQAQDSEPEVCAEFGHWLIRQVDVFTQSVETYQEELVNRYESRLIQSHERAEHQRDEDIANWEVFQTRTRELAGLLEAQRNL